MWRENPFENYLGSCDFLGDVKKMVTGGFDRSFSHIEFQNL
jgi:hypothetical protein